jgi:DNA recombination protein Rad52
MGFGTKQLISLRCAVEPKNVQTRLRRGKELNYIEGHYAISEANRIFGYDGWDRETVEARCVFSREVKGNFLTAYVAKIRVSVRTKTQTIVREAHGCGEARGETGGEAHEFALKTAETDATKRALSTFGSAFGLSLYGSGKVEKVEQQQGPLTSADNAPPRSANPGAAVKIDKSVLTFGAAKRIRDKAHLRFVASEPCLLCSKAPSDPHHLRFAQPRALGMKVSDEFVVPLCREHHQQLHQAGNELAWWHDMGIDPLPIAKDLWNETAARATQSRDAAGGEKNDNVLAGSGG